MKKFFLVGKNINHSLSPFIYNYLFKYYDIEASYETVEKDINSFPDFIRNYKEYGYEGGNITAPFKIMAYYLLDGDYKGGSFNLVYNNKGYNTDFLGMRLHYPIMDNEKILILGYGGAAKAIEQALKYKNFLYKRVVYIKSSKRQDELPNCELSIINTIPAKYYNYSILENINGTKKMDIVYKPLKTPFLKDAPSDALNGLHLLVWQAIESFKIFCDKDASSLKDELIEILQDIYR